MRNAYCRPPYATPSLGRVVPQHRAVRPGLPRGDGVSQRAAVGHDDDVGEALLEPLDGVGERASVGPRTTGAVERDDLDAGVGDG